MIIRKKKKIYYIKHHEKQGLIINTVGAKLAKFISIDKNKYNEQKVNLYEFNFKNEEIINTENVKDIIKKNLPKKFKKISVVINSTHVITSCYKIPVSSKAKADKLFQKDVLSLIDDSAYYVFIKESKTKKEFVYQVCLIPNDYLLKINNMLKELKVNVQSYGSEGDYFSLLLPQSKNYNVFLMKERDNLKTCSIYIYNGKVLVDQISFRSSSSEKFIVTFSSFISSFESKSNSQIENFFVSDNSKFIQKSLKKFEISFKEVTL